MTVLLALLIAIGLLAYLHPSVKLPLTGRRVAWQERRDLLCVEQAHRLNGTWGDYQRSLEPTEPAHLAALTVADVVYLQESGWEAPLATARRVQAALDAIENAANAERVRQLRQAHLSPAQRALADEADNRIRTDQAWTAPDVVDRRTIEDVRAAVLREQEARHKLRLAGFDPEWILDRHDPRCHCGAC